MIEIPPLTPEIIAELSAGLPGCDFDDPNQREFLTNTGSCDVQAVPGNGKTTLIVAKLALLSRSWKSRTHGICVISHTNAARQEVERRLASHPAASAFLTYPHFIGTVTAFIDRFLALPYLRGFGWPLQRIDDDLFSTVALARYREKPTLRASSLANGGARRHQVETWVSNLQMASDFEARVGEVPTRLQVRQLNGQPGASTNSGRELEELKADLVKSGFFRFEDMTALAERALNQSPALLQRIRARFPLVLLDEAQDTSGSQLRLLNRLFSENVAYQRMGDQNQTLYEDEELGPDDYWRAGEGAIPLNTTRRFGGDIARFASRLTARSPQQIEGVKDQVSHRAIILFDKQTISRVLPEYANQIRANCEKQLSVTGDLWAVASRHNLYRDNTGEWPKSLVDYCPEYRSGGRRRLTPETLCSALRGVCVLHQAAKSPAEVMQLITGALTELLNRHGMLDTFNQRVSRRTLWQTLAARDPNLPLRARRLIRDRILYGTVAWNEVGWDQFCADLQRLLGFAAPYADSAIGYIHFDPEGAQTQGAPQSKTEFVDGSVTIKLGSIHSVKGRTVDSVLVVETEVRKGAALAMRRMDVASVLPSALGVEQLNFNTNAALLSAATNVFVGVTRPRHLLALAVRKGAVSETSIEAANAQGWIVCDVTSN
jgi:DNA helicase-2/ATP-dependent DNA helicase PcrA